MSGRSESVLETPASRVVTGSEDATATVPVPPAVTGATTASMIIGKGALIAMTFQQPRSRHRYLVLHQARRTP